MEVFVEQQIVAPIRIALKLLRAAENRPSPGFVAQEDAGQSIGDFVRDLEQVHQVAGSGGALDFEVVTIVDVVVQQSADNQRVDLTRLGCSVTVRQNAE